MYAYSTVQQQYHNEYVKERCSTAQMDDAILWFESMPRRPVFSRRVSLQDLRDGKLNYTRKSGCCAAYDLCTVLSINLQYLLDYI